MQAEAAARAAERQRQRAAEQQRHRAAEQQPRPTQTRQGNANRNASAGAASGSRAATSRSSGSGGRANQAGNAAASNYPGVVMACLSRAGRPNVRGGGTARVSFSVSGNGRITGVALARRSGNAALDNAAVRLIARAGSCPPPPPGAQRSFSIGVQAR